VLDSAGTEVATTKQQAISFGKAWLRFPAGSPHAAHELLLTPVKWYRRTNEWVHNSVPYQWRCDSKYLANRMTLIRRIGGRDIVVARYAQRWGSWITGGVLLVDEKEIDPVVAILTCNVMLIRMMLRAAERTKYSGGGGGGGGGGS
jgi:hypothetical protein